MKRQPEPKPTSVEVWITPIERPFGWFCWFTKTWDWWYDWKPCQKCKKEFAEETGWTTVAHFPWGRPEEDWIIGRRFGCQVCFPTGQSFWDFLFEKDCIGPLKPPKGGSGTEPRPKPTPPGITTITKEGQEYKRA
jgi:hypothetical protein